MYRPQLEHIARIKKEYSYFLFCLIPYRYVIVFYFFSPHFANKVFGVPIMHSPTIRTTDKLVCRLELHLYVIPNGAQLHP